MRKVEKIHQEQHRLKLAVWSCFCSKDYPDGLSNSQFFNIVLQQAKKTYLRYVRLYSRINWCEDKDATKNKIALFEKDLSKMVLTVASVQDTFLKTAQFAPFKRQYSFFLETSEQFVLGILDDYLHNLRLVHNALGKKLAA